MSAYSMRLKVLLVFQLFLVLSVQLAENKRDFKIILERCEYSVRLKRLIQYTNCSIRPHPNRPRAGNALFGDIQLAVNVSNFDFQLSFDMLRKDNTKINLINYSLNGCKFLQGTYSHDILKANWKELRRSGNFPKKCPILMGIRYKIEGFTVQPDDYPPIMPSLTFICKVKFIMNGEYCGHFNIHGMVQKI